MSEIREKFITVLETLPYDLDREVLKRDTKEILQEITQKYVDMYGIADLSEDDKECIQSFIGEIWIKKGKWWLWVYQKKIYQWKK